MIFKQLHNTSASKGSKKMKYHVSMLVEQLKEACNLYFLVTSVWAAALSVFLI